MSRSHRSAPSFLIFFLSLTSLICASASGADEATTAKELLTLAGRSGGLVVHVGCGDGRLTAELARRPSYLVHGLTQDAAELKAARANVDRAGRYGEASIDLWDGNRLPYAESIVTVLVVETAGSVSDEEISRVVAPEGVILQKRGGNWSKTIKPRPTNIDEWTHYLHDSSGNAVANDDVVGPPRQLQWLGSPRWSRHHDRMASMSALVSASNRLFYIMDEGSRISIQLPSKWTLVARDAFNGVILWKKSIPTWHNHLWPLKSGPTQLARRLVAVGDRVYVTLGIRQPVSILDAATGELIRTIPGTESTEELIVRDNMVYAMANPGVSELANYEPLHNVGDQGRVAREWQWNEKPRRIVAADADTGKVLWSHDALIAPLTMASSKNRVCFYDGSKVVALDAKTGESRWNSTAAKRRPSLTMNFGPKLVFYDDVVLFAGGDRLMHAYAVDDGKEVWSAPHARGGYQSPEDLLVAGGLIWSAPTTSGRDSGVFTGRDPKTGEVKQEFPPDVETYWFHHRCYIAKATDKFLMPSRTGIEFVDVNKQHWDIHHWVRGGCHYGIMPCNGLVYAPPHNCACYPEAKLYGLNALAPASSAWTPPQQVDEAGRLEKGPAFGQPVVSNAAAGDWGTYRGGAARHGHTESNVTAVLAPDWSLQLGGRLTALTTAEGKVFVAQIDRHKVHAIDVKSGKTSWTFTTGGRVDSPPTIDKGRAIFGCVDGWVYCLRVTDGELIWRYRAAPEDRRTVAFEQLESIWPVHGSVLIEGDVVYCVAGRSAFLDGGMRLLALDAKTGKQVGETLIGDTDTETGKPLQDNIATLQMPVGLPDILSSDGHYLYMKSQRFDHQGRRQGLGPVSGNAAEHGGAQRGEFKHLFAPMGFLDGDWFHRSYWVFGKNFAGGHNGYYQAGKYAPSGRILVADDESVYGFARKPQYYKWTTTIEHQLFASGKEPPEVTPSLGGRGKVSMIDFGKPKSLSPAGVPITIEAWVNAERPQGVVVARGGPQNGYAIVIRKGVPQLVVALDSKRFVAPGKKRIAGKWTHLVGVVDDGSLRFYVDGKLVSQAQTPGLIKADPLQGLQIGADDASGVGNYKSPLGLTGLIDEVRIYHTSLNDEQIARRFEDNDYRPEGATVVLECSFDKATAADASEFRHKAKVQGATPVPGKFGRAIRFRAKSGPQPGSFVKHRWAVDLPIYAQAMVSTPSALFVAGSPDVIDEEETFKKLTVGDPTVQKLLKKQDEALDGQHGGILVAVNKDDGKLVKQFKLNAPPVWDGMAAAHGRLFVTTKDGKVHAFLGKKAE